MSDHLDDFLDREFSCDAKGALQAALRDRTTRLLRRRRRLRWLALAGMAAACYLAGMATMWWTRPQPLATDQAAVDPPKVLVKDNNPPPAVEKAAERAEIVEMHALADPAGRAAQLRLAGDLYLQQEHDYDSALRCYKQALDAGGPEALAFSPDDNWLVMSLKNARRTEALAQASDAEWLNRAIKRAERKEKANDY